LREYCSGQQGSFLEGLRKEMPFFGMLVNDFDFANISDFLIIYFMTIQRIKNSNAVPFLFLNFHKGAANAEGSWLYCKITTDVPSDRKVSVYNFSGKHG
jgi:hypothetical protein